MGLYKFSEMGEKAVSDSLDVTGFTTLDCRNIFVHELERFNLQGKGVEVTFPEPLRRTKLYVVRIVDRNLLKSCAKEPAMCAVLEAQGNICDSVLDRANSVNWNRLEVVRCLVCRTNEMPIAALYGEAVGQC